MRNSEDALASWSDWISKHRFAPSPSASALILIVAVLIITRVVSLWRSSSTAVAKDGAKTVPLVPYWIPVLGHVPNMVMDSMNFTKRVRDSYRNGIFALNLGGSVHNFVYGPGLSSALLGAKHVDANTDELYWYMTQALYGCPSDDRERYFAAYAKIVAAYKVIQIDPQRAYLAGSVAERMKQHIANLVSFAPSLVDQMPWERASDVRIMDSEGAEAEVSLFSLLRNFVAHNANPSIIGTDFLNKFPNFTEDVWTFDRGFMFLLVGIPRWFPIPAATRAYIARRHILDNLCTFHEAVDKYHNGEDAGPEWSSLDDVGEMFKLRAHVYRKYGFSIPARASLDLSFMWAANANIAPFVFWMINRIYADKALLAMLREETSPYVTVVQPKQEFPIPEPTRVDKFDLDGLCSECPLLKSVYIECLRLDGASTSLKVAQQDFVLRTREKDAGGWLLRKGQFCHVSHDLHNTDPNAFDDPMMFKPDRHIKTVGDKRTAEMGSMRPYGGGTSMCKGRAFAFQEAMMFTAAIIAMWEFEPKDGGEWKLPKQAKTAGVFRAESDTTVLIRRRRIPVGV